MKKQFLLFIVLLSFIGFAQLGKNAQASQDSTFSASMPISQVNVENYYNSPLTITRVQFINHDTANPYDPNSKKKIVENIGEITKLSSSDSMRLDSFADNLVVDVKNTTRRTLKSCRLGVLIWTGEHTIASLPFSTFSLAGGAGMQLRANTSQWTNKADSLLASGRMVANNLNIIAIRVFQIEYTDGTLYTPGQVDVSNGDLFPPDGGCIGIQRVQLEWCEGPNLDGTYCSTPTQRGRDYFQNALFTVVTEHFIGCDACTYDINTWCTGATF